MFKITKIISDATIYEHLPELNSGVDPQLELIKYRVGDIIPTQSFEFQEWPTASKSRILINFDVSDLVVGEHYLMLHVSTMTELSSKDIPLKIHRVLEPWVEGFGNRNDFPYINSGVNWISTGADEWTEPYISVDTVSHVLKSDDNHVLINISALINNVITNDLEFNGLLIRFDDESNDLTKYEIRFYGSDTQSIYEPTIISYNADSAYAGAFNPTVDVDLSNIDCIVTNIKRKYNLGEAIKLKLRVKSKVSVKTYDQALNTATTTLRIPATSSFQIVDSVTGKMVVPYNATGTLIQKTDQGYMIKFSSENILPNRYYTVQLKFQNGTDVFIYDNDLNFLIE